MSQYPVPPQHPNPYLGLRPHRGTLILVLGILGLVVCGVCGIVAWVMGKADLAEMDAGRMDPAGRDLTNIGRILGIIACCLMLAGVALALVWIIFALAVGGAAIASGAR